MLTFYDIVIDFLLFDAFDDLENPPSSVTTVVQNRWLSNGFKETVSPTLLVHHPSTPHCKLPLIRAVPETVIWEGCMAPSVFPGVRGFCRINLSAGDPGKHVLY